MVQWTAHANGDIGYTQGKPNTIEDKHFHFISSQVTMAFSGPLFLLTQIYLANGHNNDQVGD